MNAQHHCDSRLLLFQVISVIKMYKKDKLSIRICCANTRTKLSNDLCKWIFTGSSFFLWIFIQP